MHAVVQPRSSLAPRRTSAQEQVLSAVAVPRRQASARCSTIFCVAPSQVTSHTRPRCDQRDPLVRVPATDLLPAPTRQQLGRRARIRFAHGASLLTPTMLGKFRDDLHRSNTASGAEPGERSDQSRRDATTPGPRHQGGGESVATRRSSADEATCAATCLPRAPSILRTRRSGSTSPAAAASTASGISRRWCSATWT